MSRFFSPPLSSLDRLRVLRTTGLDKIDFEFIERVSGFDYRVWVQTKGRVHSLIGDAHLREMPRFEWSHELLSSSFFSLRETGSLWEDLFPFPFSLFARTPKSERETIEWKNFQSVEPQIRSWIEIVQTISDWSQERELSAVWLENEGRVSPILIHTVRGKRIRVGLSAHLAETADETDFGVGNADVICARFGAEVGILRVSVNPNSNFPVFNELSRHPSGLLFQQAHGVVNPSPSC